MEKAIHKTPQEMQHEKDMMVVKTVALIVLLALVFMGAIAVGIIKNMLATGKQDLTVIVLIFGNVFTLANTAIALMAPSPISFLNASRRGNDPQSMQNVETVNAENLTAENVENVNVDNKDQKEEKDADPAG